MDQPRYQTERAPVAAVPPDKMFLWIVTLEHLREILKVKIADCRKYDIPTPLYDTVRENLEDMYMFLQMSHYEYSDWLGMDSPAIRCYREHKRLKGAFTTLAQDGSVLAAKDWNVIVTAA